MNINLLETICLENKIPILNKESVIFICKLINKLEIKNMLEIGSGYGYSSLFIYLHSNIVSILSLEKNKNKFNFLDKIQNKYQNAILYKNTNAFDFDTYKKYDLIFIDGPKSNQDILFSKFENYLNYDGIIVIDNLHLNRLKKIESKRVQKLIDKNNQFKNYLMSLEHWSIKFLNIGDGLALCMRK